MSKDHKSKPQEFQAEVGKLLHLMVHSVYSEADIFLRELISNGSDACDKLRYEAIAHPELIADGEAPRIRVVPDKNRLVIEGVNLIKRHTKPNPGKSIKGGIVEREASVHASNVQLVCPECGAQTRIGHKTLGDDRKVRICRKCEGVVDK